MGRGIQAEIKQAKPLSSLEEDALISLQRTADQLQWHASELLKPYGISPTQYNALRILRGAKDEGRSCSEIAERMINRDPDITRLIDRLERRGLVQRAREERDRGGVIAGRRPAGHHWLKGLDRPVEQPARKILGPSVNTRRQTLTSLTKA